MVFISEDLDELRQLSDRIAVLYNGGLAGYVNPTASASEIGELMLGGSPDAPHAATEEEVAAVSALGAAGDQLDGVRDLFTWSRIRHVLTPPRCGFGMYLFALALFGAFVALKHTNPFDMYRSMWDSTLSSSFGKSQVLDRMAPYVLAAFAVTVPARAGLVNIGGEGQLTIGAVSAGGAMLLLGDHGGTFVSLLTLGLAACVGGALWSGIAGSLKLVFGVDEAISTLLLNYVAIEVLNYFVFGPWKDASGNGQPVGRELSVHQTMPTWSIFNSHISILVALVVVAVVTILMSRTKWGFQLRAVGGNREAARRAGLPVGPLLLSAMLVGGALAGLAGMVQYTQLEGQLHQGLGASFGYTAFLVSWLARHQPLKVVFASLLLAVIAVGGDSLQLSSNLPGATVNVLTAVVLLVVLSYRQSAKRAA